MPAPNAGSDTMHPTTMEVRGDREIVMTRLLNGPPHIVFKAYTEPEFVRRWWAPKSLGVSLLSCDADVRAGGRYRYVLLHRTGGHLGFSGRYTEVTPYTRIVYTQVFEPKASEPNATEPAESEYAVVTVTFEEREGKTLLTSHELYPSKAVRDGVVASGMEKGMRETMDQLDELVASLR